MNTTGIPYDTTRGFTLNDLGGILYKTPDGDIVDAKVKVMDEIDPITRHWYNQIWTELPENYFRKVKKRKKK